ncbi:MAG: ferredoxin [bacterium]
MARRVYIDAPECVACGTCVELCPDVFRLEEGAEAAEVIMPTGGPEDKIQEAMDACPTQCIHWEV